LMEYLKSYSFSKVMRFFFLNGGSSFLLSPVAYLFDTSDWRNQCIGLHQPGTLAGLCTTAAGVRANREANPAPTKAYKFISYDM
jgi:hypothetical protein